MIAYIEGTLVESALLSAIIDVGGLGYEVHTPLTTTERLSPPGSKVKLFTLAVYREDSQSLYGFISRADRDFFRLLVEKVSGIGPKIALSILSKMSVQTLENAIAQGDIALLSKCPGIGKKTAERLIIELKDKVTPVGSRSEPTTSDLSTTSSSVTSNNFQDAVAALVTLGYKVADADKAIRKAQSKLPENADTQDLIKKALG